MKLYLGQDKQWHIALKRKKTKYIFTAFCDGQLQGPGWKYPNRKIFSFPLHNNHLVRVPLLKKNICSTCYEIDKQYINNDLINVINII